MSSLKEYAEMLECGDEAERRGDGRTVRPAASRRRGSVR